MASSPEADVIGGRTSTVHGLTRPGDEVTVDDRTGEELIEAFMEDRIVLGKGGRIALSCAMVVYVVHLIYAVLAHRMLYGDGAHYLLSLLQREGALYGDVGRRFAKLVLQLPGAVAIKAGVTDVGSLEYIYGASLLFPFLISLAICAFAARRRPEFLVFPLVSLFAGTINSEFDLVSESRFCLAIFWPLLFLMVFSRSTRGLVGVAVLAVPMLRSYQSMMFFGLILAGVAVWRALESKGWWGVRLYWFGLVGWFLAGVSVAIRSAAGPNKPPRLANFLQSTVLFMAENREVHAPAVLSLVLLGLLLAIALKPAMGSHVFSRVGVAWGVACAAVALLPLIWPTGVAVQLQHRARVLNVYLPLVLSCVMLAVHSGWPVIRPVAWRRAFLLAAILGISQGLWQLGATYQWTRYLEVFRQELRAHAGLVPFEGTALARLDQPPYHISQGMNWLWTIPSMSITLAHDGNVQTIIDQPISRAGKWRPFDPAVPEELPELSRYGVGYGRYILALSENAGTVETRVQ